MYIKHKQTPLKISRSVRVRVVDHESGPLGHLSEVAVGCVVELHRSEVGAGLQQEGELKAGLLAVQAGQDSDVVLQCSPSQIQYPTLPYTCEQPPQHHNLISKAQHRFCTLV